MPETLWSAPHAYLARVDEDIIVLDLLRDRYDGLMEAADVVQIGDTGALHPADPAVADQLIEAGIAVRTPGPPRRPLIAPRRELAVDPRPPRGDVIRAGVVLASATLKFRGRSLSRLVAFDPPLRGPPPRSEARLEQLVGAARAARPWIPFEGECLQRAFLLRSWLAAQGVRTDWVFGVRTWPFAAHCWLQIGDQVVGDRLERARRFVPILRA